MGNAGVGSVLTGPGSCTASPSRGRLRASQLGVTGVGPEAAILGGLRSGRGHGAGQLTRKD
eukprot:6025412-Lingulodinium_polyedra.AAC.1